MERAADLLWRLSPPRLGMRPLRAWHERFLDRYGVGRLVPLLEALDPTTGIGAPAGYTWPRSEAPAPAADSAADPARDRLLTALLTEAVRDGRREVELDELTLARLASPGTDPVDLPASCELYLHLTSASVDDLSAGRFQLTIAPNPGSHQAGATLARFAGLNPDSAGDLATALRHTPVAVDGARPVNLAYQPHAARAANIAHTPAYTGERISVGLGPSPAAEEMPLPHVGIGATLERLFAVDLRTGQEITPMAHNMLSPAVQAPNPARLLWEVGHEGQRLWEPWDWGVASASPFLPRVRSGRLVLLPATWKVDALRDADRADSSDASWAKALASWRTSWRLPQRVLALSSDQRLLLDLDDVWHQHLLREEVRKDPALVVQEPPGGDAADEWLCDGHGPHVAEIVVPLDRRDGQPLRAPAGARPGTLDRRTPLQRRSGEPWLYLRTYGARAHQDDLLRHHLPPLLNVASAAGADRWFFLRYSDPDGQHLRLRLHAPAERLWAVTPAVLEQLTRWQAQGLIGRWLIDDYDPELERYGGPAALPDAERVFAADSAAALALLNLADTPGGHDLNTLAAISVTSLCAAFGPPAAERWVPDPAAGDPAAAWLSTTGDARQPLAADQRRNLPRWRRLLDPVGGWPQLASTPAGAQVLAALADRDAAAAAYGETVRAGIAAGTCPTPQVRIVGSLLHMTCNRLFGGYPARESDTLAVARVAVWDNLNRRRHT